MKLIVQVPCFNEESNLATTLAAIPRRIAGIERVEVVVVDDGSVDGTVKIARNAGADYIVRHSANKGLAAAFSTGLDACLRLGADIIVNTDGDNQYVGADIPRLIAPILDGEAEMVIGDRQTATTPHFSQTKKWLQRFGSWLVGLVSRTQLPDAVSGFRAFSRDAAIRLNICSTFSHTIETLVQAGNQRMAIVSVRVRTNPPSRPSRLFKSIPQFIARSAITLIRAFAMYRPLAIFIPLGGAFVLVGSAPIVRFLLLYLAGQGQGHLQSLVLGGVLVSTGLLTLMIGLLAELTALNRRLIEMTLERVRRIELHTHQFLEMPVPAHHLINVKLAAADGEFVPDLNSCDTRDANNFSFAS